MMDLLVSRMNFPGLVQSLSLLADEQNSHACTLSGASVKHLDNEVGATGILLTVNKHTHLIPKNSNPVALGVKPSRDKYSAL